MGSGGGNNGHEIDDAKRYEIDQKTALKNQIINQKNRVKNHLKSKKIKECSLENFLFCGSWESKQQEGITVNVTGKQIIWKHLGKIQNDYRCHVLKEGQHNEIPASLLECVDEEDRLDQKGAIKYFGISTMRYPSVNDSFLTWVTFSNIPLTQAYSRQACPKFSEFNSDCWSGSTYAFYAIK